MSVAAHPDDSFEIDLDGVEARRHFKRSVKTDDGARLSPPSALDRGGAFLRAIDDADHLADDKLFPPFKPGEAKARPVARQAWQEVLGDDDALNLDAVYVDF